MASLMRSLLQSFNDSFKGSSQSQTMSSQSTEASSVDPGVSLHDAAVRGNKRKLLKLLDKGLAIDYPNSRGQTALFCACYDGRQRIADILLHKGANPNVKCMGGCTPLHAAAFSGNIIILSRLVQYGGDLRLHDCRGRSVNDWAKYQSDLKKRDKMLDFLDKIKLFALTQSGRDLVGERQSREYYETYKAEGSHSLLHLIRRAAGKTEGRRQAKDIDLKSSVHSLGFGKICLNRGEGAGVMAIIPLVPENDLHHDAFGVTYDNGPFMVNESMHWCNNKVTAKRLHKRPHRPIGGVVDLLITENEYMARLHHPNILLLMAVCQTNRLDGLVLVYERVGLGSLFHHLHREGAIVDKVSGLQIMHDICEAVAYLHQQNLLHCYITSHAVQLITSRVAKLGNFEYMTERVSRDGTSPRTDVGNNKCVNAAYNWMSPELMAGDPPSETSDVYSICAVLWEIFNRNPPWNGLEARDIMGEMLECGYSLHIDSAKVVNPMDLVLSIGLHIDEATRSRLSVRQLRDVLVEVLKGSNPSGKDLADPTPTENSLCDDTLKASRSESPPSEVNLSDGEQSPLPVQSHNNVPTSREDLQCTPAQDSDMDVPPPLPSRSPPSKNNPFNREWTEDDEREIHEIATTYAERLRQPYKPAFTETNCKRDVSGKLTSDADLSEPSRGALDDSFNAVQLQTGTLFTNDDTSPSTARVKDHASKLSNPSTRDRDCFVYGTLRRGSCTSTTRQSSLRLVKRMLGTNSCMETGKVEKGIDRSLTSSENMNHERFFHRVGSQSSWTGIYDYLKATGCTSPGTFKPASHRQSMDNIVSPSKLKAGQSSLLTPEVPSQTGSLHQVFFPCASMKTNRSGDVIQPRVSTLPRSFNSQQKGRTENFEKTTAEIPTYRSKTYLKLLPSTGGHKERTSPERVSPREQRSLWYGGTGNIKHLIEEFHHQWEAHKEHQAVLVYCRNRQLQEDPANTVTDSTNHQITSKQTHEVEPKVYSSSVYIDLNTQKPSTSPDIALRGSLGESPSDKVSENSNNNAGEERPDAERKPKIVCEVCNNVLPKHGRFDMEEFYFDDILDSSLCKERYMRLQATLPFDHTLNSPSAQGFFQPVEGVKNTSTPVAAVQLTETEKEINTPQLGGSLSSDGCPDGAVPCESPRLIPPRRGSLQIAHIDREFLPEVCLPEGSKFDVDDTTRGSTTSEMSLGDQTGDETTDLFSASISTCDTVHPNMNDSCVLSKLAVDEDSEKA